MPSVPPKLPPADPPSVWPDTDTAIAVGYRDRPSADARNQQQVGEIGRAAISRRSQGGVQSARDHIACPHLMAIGQDQMR